MDLMSCIRKKVKEAPAQCQQKCPPVRQFGKARESLGQSLIWARQTATSASPTAELWLFFNEPERYKMHDERSGQH